MWLKKMLWDGIVKKTEMIVKKSHGYQSLAFLKYIFFGWGVYLVTGGVSKSEVSFVSVKGYGVWRVPSGHFGGSGVGGVATRPILDIYHQVTHN